MFGLRVRMTFIFIFISCGIISFMSIILTYDSHNNIALLQKKNPNVNPIILEMGKQYELIVRDSIKWTTILTIILAVMASFYIAKRITAP